MKQVELQAEEKVKAMPDMVTMKMEKEQVMWVAVCILDNCQGFLGKGR